jgi:hypothetical protein
VLILACGFEPRSIAILKRYVEEERAPAGVVIIEYAPSDRRNKKKELRDLLRELQIPTGEQLWLCYHRFQPDSFEPLSHEMRRFLRNRRKLVLDISGMSRLLIALVLDACNKFEGGMVIGYSEALVYHPTESAFKSNRKAVKKSSSAFVTGDVYEIVAALPLSTVTMQGHARVLIAFATFNPRELVALLNELSVQHLILIEGKPHLEKDLWRLRATQDLNSRVDEVIAVAHLVASTFDYDETARILIDAYSKYGETHKILVAPIGSKLQTVAVFLSMQVWPDVQIVYPVAKSFFTEYTEGVASIWQIKFDSYRQTIDQMRRLRMASLDNLRKQIDQLSTD